MLPPVINNPISNNCKILSDPLLCFASHSTDNFQSCKDSIHICSLYFPNVVLPYKNIGAHLYKEYGNQSIFEMYSFKKKT